MKLISKQIALVLVSIVAFSCAKDTKWAYDQIPHGTQGGLMNDCIERLPMPLVVGEKFELVYAMALPKTMGKLINMEVTSSIAGGPDTYIDPNSYYTNDSGTDKAVKVANPSALSGTVCSTTFSVDTCAATLRYYWHIPEAARGQKVSFTLKVTASNGQSAEYKMGPYQVRKMDIVRGMQVNQSAGRVYISIKNGAVYTAAEIASGVVSASDIDIMYNYTNKTVPVAPGSSTTTQVYGQGFYAPGGTGNADFPLPATLSVPAGCSNSTLLVPQSQSIRDRQITNFTTQWSEFVDDEDLVTFPFKVGGMPYAVRILDYWGFWVQTADKKYCAYFYPITPSTIGTATTLTWGMKRYEY